MRARRFLLGTSALLLAAVIVQLGVANPARPGAQLVAPRVAYVALGWSSVSLMGAQHIAHTATLLSDGDVLVVGGRNSQAAAERYRWQTDSWSQAGALAAGRASHTASLLPSGKVLVAGGSGAGGALASAQLYDPVANEWSPTGPMKTGRYTHTATRLNNGKILVTGGVVASGNPTATAEIYDPGTGTWADAGPMSTARAGHTATRLDNGEVLVAGGVGQGGPTLASAEVYDPTADDWRPAGSMAVGRFFHTATRLQNGQILVAGGTTQGASTTAERFDPQQDAWIPSGSLNAGRTNHAAALLADGRVLISGGATVGGSPAATDSSDLYTPDNNSWGAVPSMHSARADLTATTLGSGQVLVTGGGSSGVGDTAEIFTAVTSIDAAASAGFPVQDVGTASAVKTIDVSNLGENPLLITAARVTGPHAADFTVEAEACEGVAVAMGASCPIHLRFKPTTAGNRSATLAYEANTATGTHTVALTGTGHAVATPTPTPPAGTPTPTPVPTATPTPVPTVTPPKPRPRSTVRLPFKGGYRIGDIPRAKGCRGRITLTLKLGRRVLARRSATLNRRCRYHTTFRVKRRKIGDARRLSVVVRFHGNRHLGATTNRFRLTLPKT